MHDGSLDRQPHERTHIMRIGISASTFVVSVRIKVLILALILETALVSAVCFAQTSSIAFRPIAAEYSASLDRIIMVSANPNQLHIYEPAGPADTTVNLPKPPLSLVVSPDGLHAAVGHDALISYVNLSGATVENTLPVPLVAQSITMSADWIYVMPTYVGNSVSVNIATGAVTPNNNVFYGSGGRLNTAVNAIYGTRDGLSPNDIEKYNISTGPITAQTDSIYHGDYPVCGPVFFSPDGGRIYDGCSTVFRASTDLSLDMRYVTTLAGATSMRSLTESKDIKRVALIQAPSDFRTINDSVVLLYESDYLTPVGQFVLLDFQAGSRSFIVHGKWVFFNAASTVLYVVVQADQSSGILNDFAVQTISLTPVFPCGASFGLVNADVIAEGALGTVPILASPACQYQAVSRAAWIEIVSGGYGSGNGTLKYIARANPAGPRAGEIAIGGITFTLTQAGASGAGALTRLPYNIVAAAYDKALDKLIFVSADPNELHIYDPLRQSEQAVPLVMPPLSVSVRPDGMYAAVGHDGWVSYVNLQTAAVVRVFQVITDVRSVLLAGNGYMYLFPARDWSDIFSLEVSSGAVTPTSAIYNGRVPRLSIDSNYMYVGGNWFSKWSISQGVARIINNNSSSVSTCGNLWLTEDGRRMFTACARVYRVSSVPAEDLQYNGTLSTLTSVTWADQSAVQQSTAVLAGSGLSQGATQLQIYGDAFLDFLGSLPLPPFTVGARLYPSYGQFVFWNSDETRLVLVVKADTSANLSSAYGISVMSPSTAGQNPFTIPNRGGVSLITTGGSGPITVGHARIRPNLGSITPAGLAIFGSRQNGALVSEATVPSSAPVQSGRIFVEVGGDVTTGLAIANPNSTIANVSFYFTDQNGVNFGSRTTTIPANGQIAAFLNEAPFYGGVSVSGTFTFSSDVPVAALALRGLNNERSEFLWTTLPVSPLVAPSAVPLVFPNFADGGGWTTQFVLVNPTDVAMSGTLQFYAQGSATAAAAPVEVTLEGETGSTFAYSIPPRSSRNLRTSGSGSSILVGSVRVVPAANSRTPSGVGIFSQKNAAGMTISEAGVPITPPAQAVRLYAEASRDSSQIQTGIAIANTAASAVDVTLELNTLTGNSIGLTGILSVPGNGQVQMFLNQIPGFENLPAPFQGVLRISTTASRGVSVVGLRSRYNERNEFLITTTSPVNESSTPISTDLLFPHLADGGGFATQFVLFSGSSAQTASGTLQFFTQGGQTLNLTLR